MALRSVVIDLDKDTHELIIEDVCWLPVEKLHLNKKQTKELEQIMFRVFNVIHGIEHLDNKDVDDLLDQEGITSGKLLAHFLKIGIDID